MTDNKAIARDRFGWQRQVLMDVELSAHARCLALIIADFINSKTGVAYPSLPTLARVSGFSRRTIINLLPHIVRQGHIAILRGTGRGRSNVYTLRNADRDTLPTPDVRSKPSSLNAAKVQLKTAMGECGRTERVKQTTPQPAYNNQRSELAEVELPIGFEQFWNSYPRKIAKDAARHAFEKSLEFASADGIVSGAIRYANARKDRCPDSAKHPAAWLNEKCWDDASRVPPSDLVSEQGRALLERLARGLSSDTARDPLRQKAMTYVATERRRFHRSDDDE